MTWDVIEQCTREEFPFRIATEQGGHILKQSFVARTCVSSVNHTHVKSSVETSGRSVEHNSHRANTFSEMQRICI